MSAATEHLKTYQGQLDPDGCYARVSRQALNECLEQYAEMLAALKLAFKIPRPWIYGSMTVTEKEWGEAVDAITNAIAKAEGGASDVKKSASDRQ